MIGRFLFRSFQILWVCSLLFLAYLVVVHILQERKRKRREEREKIKVF